MRVSVVLLSPGIRVARKKATFMNTSLTLLVSNDTEVNCLVQGHDGLNINNTPQL